MSPRPEKLAERRTREQEEDRNPDHAQIVYPKRHDEERSCESTEQSRDGEPCEGPHGGESERGAHLPKG